MTDEPNWNLLPGRAEEFFGLEASYARSDLKRSYNRILRRYKPEQFPDEFQLLRAAYEHLEEALRFGRQTSGPSTLRPTHATPVDTTIGAVETTPSRPSPCERYKQVGALTLLAELEDQEDLSADEFLALALLREADGNLGPLALHTTLASGLLHTQGDARLVHVLLEACRDPLESKDAVKLVQQLARWVQENSPEASSWYYFATTPLWVSLIRDIPFATFKILLAKCQALIGSEGHPGYLVLSLRLLRTGGQVADSEWTLEAMEDLQERYEDLPPDLCEEMDVLEWLLSYMDHREVFLEDQPGRAAWDSALLAMLSEEDAIADRAFLAATSDSLDDPEALLHSFQDWSDPAVRLAMTPLHYFAEEVYARSKEPEPSPSQKELRRKVLPFMYRLQKATARTLTGRLDNLIHMAFTLLLLAGVFLPIMLQESPMPGTIAVVLIFAVCGYIGIRRAMPYVYAWHSPTLYRKVWRSEVRQFLESHPMHVHEMIETLQGLEDEDVSDHHRLAGELNEDPGMVLYALSLRFAE
ncbi:MAG: hypothetical protein ACI9X4_000064 [Glaciecola sp.]|jgi:hypothetical protein